MLSWPLSFVFNKTLLVPPAGPLALPVQRKCESAFNKPYYLVVENQELFMLAANLFRILFSFGYNWC